MNYRLPDNPYSVHPAVDLVAKWSHELKAKTGRSLEEWCELIVSEGPPTNSDRRDWLRKEFNLGTRSIYWLVEHATGSPEWEGNPDSYLHNAVRYVDEMFAGPKAHLRPIFESLMEIGQALDSAIKFSPCKTIVPFYRNHVIAQVKPTTNKRIDFGLALGELPASGRLVSTGGFAKKDRITHRIPLTNPTEIDQEVRDCLKMAFDKDS